MLCAAVLVIAGVGVARTITARADVSPAWDGPFGAKLANQDVFNRCGADVIVVVDLTVSGNDPAQRSATTAALSGFLATVARQGNRWAVVGYGGNAQVIGAPAAAAFTPSDPTLPVTDTVDKIAELFAAPAEPSPARNWEAGLRLAADVANQAPADRPLSVVHLGRDTPTRHLANGVATTEPQDAADTSAAATAADTLRGRPSTHIYGIAVDAEGGALTTAWSAVSGPDRVVFGSRPLTAATDDLVAVPASGDLPAALAALATSFCTTSIDLTALAGKAGDQPASATTITVKPLGESTALTLAGEPAERKTSDAGKAQWHVAAATSAPFDIELTDTSATAGEQRAMLCSDFRGVLATSGGEGGKLTVHGLQPGAGVRCELRLTDTTPNAGPLLLRHTAAADALAECTGDSPRSKVAVAIGVVGQNVDHCLAVTNTGSAALPGVRVESKGLGLTGSNAWVLDGPLAPGQTATRHVGARLITALDIEAIAVAESAGRDGNVFGSTLRSTAMASHQILPPVLEVQRSLSSADRAACGAATPQIDTGQVASYCYTVSNRGGTMLDNISIDDPAIGTQPVNTAKTLAPGESATVIGSATLQTATNQGAVATARAADGHGDNLPGVGTVSSNVDPKLSGLKAEQKLSASSVPEGGEVTATVTVTNSSPTPLQRVTVRSSICGDQTRPDTTLGNADDNLERGEAWVYLCTRQVTQETYASAVVSAQDSGSTVTTRQQVRVDRANLRMKKKQSNDLRLGKETTYVLEVDNNGNVGAPGTVVTDPLDPAVTFIRATVNNGTCNLVGDAVKCSLGEIPPETNGAYVIQLVVTAKPEGVGKVVENRAQVSSAIGDFNPLDNASSAYGVIFAADQCTVASRDCSPPPPPNPDQTITTVSDTEPLRSGSTPAAAPIVPAQSPVNPRLASTGADSLLLATWACLLVASGGGLLALSRRRRLLGGFVSNSTA